jgi:hypothetical protein
MATQPMDLDRLWAELERDEGYRLVKKEQPNGH